MKYLDKSKTDNPLVDTAKVIWDHPAGKIVIGAGAAFGLLYLRGLFFRALAYAIKGVKEFSSALKS
jgi:hypothetical protein